MTSGGVAKGRVRMYIIMLRRSAISSRQLERTLRQTEFFEDQNTAGHQQFRAALPIRPEAHTFYAASDGQLGGIMKAYRDWRISGDSLWISHLYPRIKQSLDYCIGVWDPRHTGTLEEPHHNTYDIEFWGAGWDDHQLLPRGARSDDSNRHLSP
jgi:hypothetical protein